MRNPKPILVFLTTVLLCACAVAPPPQPAAAPAAPAAASATRPCNPGDTLLNATLWMQTAAEYQASAQQTYSVARRTLDAALADPSWTALPSQSTSGASLPPAIILDLDETAIDNADFESRAIRAGTAFEPKLWSQWTSEAAARPLPGAAELLAYAQSRGVTPFYVTNRNASEKAATRANLETLHYPLSASEETLLVAGEKPEWTSDKTSRRDFIAGTHRILMLFGDDLNDFTLAAGKSISDRNALVHRYKDYWGVKWFILPNPVYGSWERAMMGGATGNDDCEKKINRLR